MGSSSGGVNNYSDHCWFEGDVFEYTRDDMLHSGEGEAGDQLVVRNCKLTGAFRHSIWVHQHRLWVAHNIVEYAGQTAISAGGVPIKRRGDGKNHGVTYSIFESNVSRNARKTSYHFDGQGSGDMDHLVVRNNESFNHGMDAAFEFSKVTDTMVNDNLVAGDTSEWRIYLSPEEQAGFAVAGGKAIHGRGNRITDTRLAKSPSVIKSAEATDISIQVDQRPVKP